MITNLKELKALFKLCREQGVSKFTIKDITFEMGDVSYTSSKSHSNNEVSQEIPSDNPYANFPDGELTEEQLTFYASGGVPSEDPDNQDNH